MSLLHLPILFHQQTESHDDKDVPLAGRLPVTSLPHHHGDSRNDDDDDDDVDAQLSALIDDDDESPLLPKKMFPAQDGELSLSASLIVEEKEER